MKFAEWAKMYAALIGSVLTALAGTTGVVPDAAKPWVSLVLAILTAVATWRIPNKTDAPATPDSFDFDPPAPNWGSAGPAWDEPASPPADPEPPKSLYLVPPPLSASYYLSRAEENEVRVA